MAEKTLLQVPRAWRELYEKGRTALERNNLDYALQIFTQVVEKEPGFYECREALRAAQFKKAGLGGSGFFKKMLGSANPKLVQAQVALRSRPLEALALAEHVLNADPHNLSGHRVVGEAALALGFTRTAVLSLEIIYKQAPRDRDVILKLSTALAKAGHGARAETIITELARSYPDDMEVAQALKDISANRTLDEGGYDALADGKGSYRDILADEQEAVSLEQEKREHKTEDVADRLITEYEERLRKEPQNLRLLRAIAELYADQKHFDRALEAYERLAQSEAADPSLERAIADTQVRKLDHALAQLDSAAPDYAATAERLKAEKQAFLLDDCQGRVERYPNDLQLRFELGLLFFQAGRLTEAIQEFQKAQNNPHKRIPALYHLGRCFGRRGMHDLAARTFQNALREKQVFDDEKKELIYALGCALEKMAKKEEAIEYFKQIYEVDIAYQDVAAKVDAYYGVQS